jgi:carboxylesterase
MPPTFRLKGLNPDIKLGILLLHAPTGNVENLRPLAQKLEGAGAIVSTAMLAGVGGNDKDMLVTTWQEWLDGAQTEFDSLAKQCDSIVIAGLSFAAILSMIIASRNEKAAGLGLLSPRLNFGRKGSTKSSPFSPFVRLRTFGRKADDCAPDASNAFLLKQLDHLVKYCREAAPHVNCPTLVLYRLEDSLTAEADALETYRLVGARDKRLVLLSKGVPAQAAPTRQDAVANHMLKLAIDASYYQPSIGALTAESYPKPIFSR